MKTSTPGKKTRKAVPTSSVSKLSSRRIHPVVIYPFRQPEDLKDLNHLYELIAKLDANRDTYTRPITVIDSKTQDILARNAKHLQFRNGPVARHSDILEAWCVDTCQMWYSGLGKAYENGGADDVYWLIPGDFDYGSTVGRDVLSRLHDLPEICEELDQDLSIGEIATSHNNSKHLIDTYGTFALLYTWFPKEAGMIREFTERPRSEFFAIRHAFLGEMLHRRWYGYEQTVVMLLHASFDSKRISRFFVGNISDLPEGGDSLSSAMQQVERTERVLKTLWRERHHQESGWSTRYRQLEAQSEQVRSTAFTLLENLLH
jgi:hypothetical protein